MTSLLLASALYINPDRTPEVILVPCDRGSRSLWLVEYVQEHEALLEWIEGKITAEELLERFTAVDPVWGTIREAFLKDARECRG